MSDESAPRDHLRAAAEEINAMLDQSMRFVMSEDEIDAACAILRRHVLAAVDEELRRYCGRDHVVPSTGAVVRLPESESEAALRALRARLERGRG